MVGEIKSAMLFNLCKFVEWPETSFQNPTAPIVLGIFGDNAFAVLLDRLLADKQVQNRKFEVKYLGSTKNVPQEEWQTCHLLFVPTPENPGASSILISAKNLPILTVGEDEAFLEAGGIFALPAIDNQIKIQLNEIAAKDSGLKINGKLSRLAMHWTQK